MAQSHNVYDDEVFDAPSYTPADVAAQTGTAPPAAAAVTYTAAGFDNTGSPIYKGSDGKLYTNQTQNGQAHYVEIDPQSAVYPTAQAGMMKSPGPWADAASKGGGGYGGGAGAGSIDDSFLAPFDVPFNPGSASAYPSYPGASAFDFGDFGGFSKFAAPTAESIKSNPGFQSRLGIGESAVENSAAARGLLNSGGTLADILKFGQGLASQEYDNIWNRDFSTWNQENQNSLATYNTNRNNQFGNWQANTGQGQDAYNAAVGASDTAFARAQQTWQQMRDTYYKNQDSPFLKLMQASQLGLNAASA